MAGVCKALDGRKVDGTDIVLQAHRTCVCYQAITAMFCPFGHLLECHNPLTCSEANCSHYQRQQALETEITNGE